MVSHKGSTAASAAGITGSDNSEVTLEARKAEMARMAEEADAKEAEALPSAENAGDDSKGNGSARRQTMPSAIETNPTLDPFNPAALRLDQSYADTVGVKKLLTTVPVRKPNRQDFVRVHSDPVFRLTPAAIIEVKEDREVYLVTPSMAQALPGEFSTVTLYLAINRQGVPFLWPVKLPNPDGKHNEWHRSAAEAAERAMEKWVRVTSSMSLGAYEIFEASGE